MHITFQPRECKNTFALNRQTTASAHGARNVGWIGRAQQARFFVAKHAIRIGIVYKTG